MALKVKGPKWMVGTLDMGTASNGPRAIPAALQVTKAAAQTTRQIISTCILYITSSCYGDWHSKVVVLIPHDGLGSDAEEVMGSSCQI